MTYARQRQLCGACTPSAQHAGHPTKGGQPGLPTLRDTTCDALVFNFGCMLCNFALVAMSVIQQSPTESLLR